MRRMTVEVMDADTERAVRALLEVHFPGVIVREADSVAVPIHFHLAEGVSASAELIQALDAALASRSADIGTPLEEYRKGLKARWEGYAS